MDMYFTFPLDSSLVVFIDWFLLVTDIEVIFCKSLNSPLQFLPNGCQNMVNVLRDSSNKNHEYKYG